MTLHWWMHWFWVTAVALTASCCAMPPESSDKYNSETKAYHDEDDLASTETPLDDNSNRRVGKFIVFTHKPTAGPSELIKPRIIVSPYPQSSDMPDIAGEFVQRETVVIPTPSHLNKTIISKAMENMSVLHIGNSNVSNFNYVKPSDKVHPPGNYSNVTTEQFNNVSNYSSNVRQVSVTHSNNETSVSNNIQNTEESIVNKSAVFIRNDSTVSVEDNTREDNVTEKPLSLETTIDEQHILSSLERAVPTKEKISLAAASIEDQLTDGPIDTAAVAGISFAALVLVALTGATSFVLYRRRYLNKPQTLNDKCSNADSSGYIDDSTIRENSEEMYSLDNDSFLNSLEAMTIQNYWTDTVKHTKL